MCHLQTRDISERKHNWRLYRESRRKVHGYAKGMRSHVEGKERQVPVQGKQKRGPCLCCSQVAVSVTAANVWLERLGIGSAASLTLAANLLPAAFRKVV